MYQKKKVGGDATEGREKAEDVAIQEPKAIQREAAAPQDCLVNHSRKVGEAHSSLHAHRKNLEKLLEAHKGGSMSGALYLPQNRLHTKSPTVRRKRINEVA